MTVWHKGIPNKNGVYWFDHGICPKFSVKSDREPLILQMLRGEGYIFGDSGSMPLSSVYSKVYSPDARYAEIEMSDTWATPEEAAKSKSWKDKRFISSGDARRGWIKANRPGIYDNASGFALLKGWAGHIYADIAWTDCGNNASTCGESLRPNNAFSVCLVEIPMGGD